MNVLLRVWRWLRPPAELGKKPIPGGWKIVEVPAPDPQNVTLPALVAGDWYCSKCSAPASAVGKPSCDCTDETALFGRPELLRDWSFRS